VLLQVLKEMQGLKEL